MVRFRAASSPCKPDTETETRSAQSSDSSGPSVPSTTRHGQRKLSTRSLPEYTNTQALVDQKDSPRASSLERPSTPYDHQTLHFQDRQGKRHLIELIQELGSHTALVYRARARPQGEDGDNYPLLNEGIPFIIKIFDSSRLSVGLRAFGVPLGKHGHVRKDLRAGLEEGIQNGSFQRYLDFLQESVQVENLPPSVAAAVPSRQSEIYMADLLEMVLKCSERGGDGIANGADHMVACIYESSAAMLRSCIKGGIIPPSQDTPMKRYWWVWAWSRSLYLKELTIFKCLANTAHISPMPRWYIDLKQDLRSFTLGNTQFDSIAMEEVDGCSLFATNWSTPARRALIPSTQHELEQYVKDAIDLVFDLLSLGFVHHDLCFGVNTIIRPLNNSGRLLTYIDAGGLHPLLGTPAEAKLQDVLGEILQLESLSSRVQLKSVLHQVHAVGLVFDHESELVDCLLPLSENIGRLRFRAIRDGLLTKFFRQFDQASLTLGWRTIMLSLYNACSDHPAFLIPCLRTGRFVMQYCMEEYGTKSDGWLNAAVQILSEQIQHSDNAVFPHPTSNPSQVAHRLTEMISAQRALLTESSCLFSVAREIVESTRSFGLFRQEECKALMALSDQQTLNLVMDFMDCGSTV